MLIRGLPRAIMLIHSFWPGPRGGTERQAEQLASHLARIGHEIQVMTAHPIFALSPESFVNVPWQEVLEGFQIFRVPFPLARLAIQEGGNTFRYLVRKQKEYDILHCHMAYGHAVVAVIVARLFQKKCIIKIACAGEYGELFDLTHLPNSALAFEILRRTDRFIAISSEIEKELLSYGFAQEKIVRIPNGVDVGKFKRCLPFPPRQKVRFLLTGRRHPQKGVDVLIEAVKILQTNGLRELFEVVLYGNEYPQYDYAKTAREQGLGHLMQFLPFCAELLDVYHQVHAFLIPSRGEGLSNALLEAMAMELPVIASDVSGMTDVVEDGLDGILIPKEQPEALASAMARIINDPEFAVLLGQNGRRKVETHFSLESVARQYSDLYRQLCQ